MLFLKRLSPEGCSGMGSGRGHPGRVRVQVAAECKVTGTQSTLSSGPISWMIAKDCEPTELSHLLSWATFLFKMFLICN